MKLKLIYIILIVNCFFCKAFTVNGINYSIISGTTDVSVTSYQCNSSTLVISNNVEHQGIIYNVVSIGNYAFQNCSGLTSITIPNSVLSIGEGAFASCTGITSITIPNSITIIENSVFQYCTGLTSMTIPDSVLSIGQGAFASCSGLTSIIMSDSIISIGNYAFQYCTGLTSLTIPDSVINIGEGAFASCSSMTSVSIPGSLLSIGDFAFIYCSNLSTIFNFSTSPISINSNVFFSVNQTNCILYVPTGSQTLYQSAPVWQNFAPIMTLENEIFFKNLTLIIYPNPASETITISLEQSLELEKATIYNAIGQFVKSENKNIIDLKSLPKGNYFLEIVTNKGMLTKTFIIN